MSAGDDEQSPASELEKTTPGEVGPKHGSAFDSDELTAEMKAIIDETAERQASVTMQTLKSEQYRSQFPHPDHMERYAALYPEAPAIIFDSFNKQGDHRRKMEELYVRGTETRAAVGQVLGFILLAGVIGLGIYVSVLGQAVAGTTMVGLALTGGVFTYVFGVRKQNADK